MKRLLQIFAVSLFTWLGMAAALSQTEVVVTPRVSHPAAVTIGVTLHLTSDWQITSTPFEKSVNAAGLPVWSLNTLAVRSLTEAPATVRKVSLSYGIGAVPPGTTGRILWKFNGKTLSESSLVVPVPPPVPIAASATITVNTAGNTANADLGTTAKVRVNFKEYAIITGQKGPVKEGSRFILEATATPAAVIQIHPPPPLPSADLTFLLGGLTTGEYTAVFKLNGLTLAEEAFTISSHPPQGGITVTSAFETAATGTLAKVRLVMADPYFGMSDPGTPLVSGSEVKINTTLTRINTLVALPAPGIIEKNYPLGTLAPGTYTFHYSINNILSLTQTFRVEGPPPAQLQLAFVEVRPSTAGTGQVAEAGVILSDPTLTVADWGTVRREGSKFSASLTTGPRPATDPDGPAGLDGADGELAGNPLIQGQAFVASPGDAAGVGRAVRIQRFRYELGALEAGTYEFELLSGGRSIGRRQFKIQPTPPPPGPVVAAIEVSKTSTGSWKAMVRVVLPPGQTVTQWGDAKQDGQQFKVSLTIAPRPVEAGGAANGGVARPLEHFTYSLGTLSEGNYTLAVCQGENQLAIRPFVVGSTPPPPALNSPRLAFIEIKQGNVSTAAEVGVTLPQPGFAIASWGEITRDGNKLKAIVQIKKADVVPAVVQSPVLERHVYSLGTPAAGEYKLTLCWQTAPDAEPRVLGARAFTVAKPPPPPSGDPLPIIAFLVHGTNEQGSFVDLGLAFSFPGLTVTDWGTPLQIKNILTTTLVMGKVVPQPGGVDHGTPGADPQLIPDDGNINEAMVEPAREIGGWPTSLVRHRYLLGRLAAGEYQFAIAVGGKVLAQRHFSVHEAIVPKPIVTAAAEPVRRAGPAPAPFSLSFTARAGWSSDPTMGTVTVKGPAGFSAVATRLGGGIISMDPLGILAVGQYEVAAPGGAWDAADNGHYNIFFDPATVIDRQGQSPVNPAGALSVQILPEPPPPPPTLKVEVTASMADGRWTADVVFENTGGWWQAEWGSAALRGPVFLAEAKLVVLPAGSRAAIPALFSHRYLLGELKPGYYSFVFHSSAGHIGHVSLTVPGVEPPNPFEAWKFNVFGADAWNAATSGDEADPDGDGQSTLAEFVLGGNPLGSESPGYQAEIIPGPNGAPHLALRYSRSHGSETTVPAIVEMSSDLSTWHPAGDAVEITGSPLHPDGTRTVTARQTAPVASSRFPYMRLRFLKSAN